MAHVPNSNGIIPPNWVLLDTFSTDNVIKNKELLNNIRLCSEKESLEIFTNGGSLILNETGTLKHFPMDSYYNPSSIANVLSFKAVMDLKGHHVKMDTENRPGMYVVKNGKELLFRNSMNGLFYCTTDELNEFYEETNDFNNSSLCFLSSSHKKYTQQEIERAKQARELQECLMWPSDLALKNMIRKGDISNTHISTEDIDRALDIFGVAKEISAGKMVAPSKVSNKSTQILLHDLGSVIDRRLKMYVDILYVNGHPYLHTKTKEVNYITISRLKSRSMRDIKRKLKDIVKKYLT